MGACSSKSKKDKGAPQSQTMVPRQGDQQQKSTAAQGEFLIGPQLFVTLKKGSISQSYKIDKVLGEGAFGQVRLVTHKQTGITRAMKQIRKDKIIKEDEEQMFAEVNILKVLDHPNIVKLYELFQDDKNYYLVTEFLSGGELFDKIKSLNHFTEKMAAEFMKQILSAVMYCHDQKIVHRDLKPENILLESNKNFSIIKIIDFGTSRAIIPNQKLTKRLGTPYYIAPEVLKRQYDEKCDLWSCGVILFILLCGYPPFDGEEEDMMKKIELGKYEFDPDEWLTISEDAKRLIRRMLTLDPVKRISAKDAFNDPWIQKNAINIPIDQKALKNLGTFHGKSKVKSAIMQFIATQVLNTQDKSELQKAFISIDKNGDGQLSREELQEGYMLVYHDDLKCQRLVENIFAAVDTNNSGKVDFTEFMVAATLNDNLLNKEKIIQTFKMFDIDGNGQITKQELQEIMGGSTLDKQWQDILDEADKNGDGVISQQEFIDLLTK